MSAPTQQSTTKPQARVFLSAEWRWLAMLNFTIDPAVLEPFVPAGTGLDTFNGNHYVSIVGFQFLNTRVKGVPIPFHRNFEELNLRFYVRRDDAGEIKRGVVFIKEVVPRGAVAWVARTIYNENYVCLPMRHEHQFEGSTPRRLRYDWKQAGRWESVSLATVGEAVTPDDDSEETFITEHYWGYAAQKDGGTMEYEVEHPRWQVWQATDVTYECDVNRLYGAGFAEALSGEPTSAFVADGSAVNVRDGTRIA